MRRSLFALAAVVVGLLAAPAGAVEIEEVVTPLGIKAWLVQDRTAPLVALSFSFVGGTASEPESRRGVTSVMASLLTDGAATLPAQAFRLRQEEAVASLGFGASADRLAGSLQVLTASRDRGLELLRLGLTAPRFDQAMVDQRVAQAIAGLKKAEQRPRAVAERTMMASMFAGHPYGRGFEQLSETLKTLTPTDFKERAAALLRRDGLIVGAVGDIDAADLSRALDHAFGDLPLGMPGAAGSAVPDWVPTGGSRTIVVDRPVPQSAVVMAMPGILRRDPDWYAAAVLSHILGGGQQSRLFNEVREKRGLAYNVSSDLRVSEKGSLLVISTGSANERVAEAIQVIRGEIARLRDNGTLTEAEFNREKQRLLGS